MNLYIVGNGFDMAHKLPTGYQDFRNWLENNKEYIKLHDFLSRLIEENAYCKYQKLSMCTQIDNDCYGRKCDSACKWNSLEICLEKFDISYFFESASESGFNAYDAEDFSDADHHRHMQDVEFYSSFKKSFKEYLRDIVIDQIPNISPYTNKLSGHVINFNYTDTITRYEVDKSNIYYIHGQYGSTDNEFILGHSGEVDFVESYLEFEYGMDESGNPVTIGCALEPRVEELCFHYVEVYNSLIKDHGKNLKKIEHLDFSKYTKVYILGHSLGEVDMPYFEYILAEARNVDKILISYYTNGDVVNIKNSSIYEIYSSKIVLGKIEEFLQSS